MQAQETVNQLATDRATLAQEEEDAVQQQDNDDIGNGVQKDMCISVSMMKKFLCYIAIIALHGRYIVLRFNRTQAVSVLGREFVCK